MIDIEYVMNRVFVYVICGFIGGVKRNESEV